MEDAAQVELLTERLLEKGLDPAEMLLVREGLLPHAADLKEQLWLRALQTADGDFRALMAPLTTTYRDDKVSAERRAFAATVLGDYAADNFALLADLLLDATPQQYAVLFPIVAQQREATVTRMRQELERARQPDLWKDGPLDPAWTQPTEELRREVEIAQGLVAERWAMCQALPLERVTAVTEGLRSAGYRPLRVRPWVGPASRAGPERAVVVWSRDGRDWKLETALTPAAVTERAAHWQKAGYLLVMAATAARLSSRASAMSRLLTMAAQAAGFRRIAFMISGLSARSSAKDSR